MDDFFNTTAYLCSSNVVSFQKYQTLACTKWVKWFFSPLTSVLHATPRFFESYFYHFLACIKKKSFWTLVNFHKLINILPVTSIRFGMSTIKSIAPKPARFNEIFNSLTINKIKHASLKKHDIFHGSGIGSIHIH